MSSPGPIHHEKWRESAACRGHEKPETWDDQIHGETTDDRRIRLWIAKRICSTCPVRNECLAAVDWVWDEGVRAGQLLPRKKHAARPLGPKPIEHGSRHGARNHYRRGEPACQLCLDAYRRWQAPHNPSQWNGRAS